MASDHFYLNFWKKLRIVLTLVAHDEIVMENEEDKLRKVPAAIDRLHTPIK